MRINMDRYQIALKKPYKPLPYEESDDLCFTRCLIKEGIMIGSFMCTQSQVETPKNM
jgi:hypothetical protein